MRTLILAVIAPLLAGCLVSPKPAYDASNAIPAAESAKFMTFVEFLESAPDANPADSPRDIVDAGGLIVERDPWMIVQIPDGEKAEYLAITQIGRRYMICWLAGDDKLEAVAAAYGLTMARDPATGRYLDTLEIDGPKDAMRAFIEDQFETAPLVCSSDARVRKTAP